VVLSDRAKDVENLNCQLANGRDDQDAHSVVAVPALPIQTLKSGNKKR